MEKVKIPQERIAAFIGEDGKTKALLERKLQLQLSVSEDGVVDLEGDSFHEYVARDVLQAIGRGFEPKIALKLLDDQYSLKVINLREWGGDERKDLERIRGRLIGTHGKTKQVIEETAEAHVCIYGHTVAVIAPLETLDICLQAIFKLLEGANHGSVYSFLERSRRRLKEKRAEEGLW